MLVSMTGFGKASNSYASKKITAEIKSLNSKQFDISVKLPSLYREKELILRSQLGDILHRGKVDLSIYVDNGEAEKKVTINQTLALAYLSELKDLTTAGNINADKDMLSVLLTMPDILQTERAEMKDEEWQVVETTVLEAASGLLAFRRAEGEKLNEDISYRIKQIQKLRLQVEKHLEERMLTVRERIEKNLLEFVSEDKGDKNRLEQEIIYYLEKLDITEEHVRLKGHCEYFVETMKSSEMAGKKLAFISQEIGREINTMGAKANHVAIQKLVVQMKDELEKIKEQLLNIV